MTLVVSYISSFGVLMVGDSAVSNCTVTGGAAKVQYSPAANVGFALWGNAGVDSHRRLDVWLAEFISTRVLPTDIVEEIGQRLASDLNSILLSSGRPWASLARGVHLTGFRNGLPVLFHVHCGHDNEPAHELRLYRDFPDDQHWSEAFVRRQLNIGFTHLRNGYHPLFAPLFDRALQYAGDIRAQFNIRLPHPSIEGRLEFYKQLVRYVAGTLRAARVSQGVNDTLSAIAFTERGLLIDERLPVPAASGSPSFAQLF
jgi:hypothetical protein